MLEETILGAIIKTQNERNFFDSKIEFNKDKEKFFGSMNDFEKALFSIQEMIARLSENEDDEMVSRLYKKVFPRLKEKDLYKKYISLRDYGDLIYQILHKQLAFRLKSTLPFEIRKGFVIVSLKEDEE